MFDRRRKKSYKQIAMKSQIASAFTTCLESKQTEGIIDAIIKKHGDRFTEHLTLDQINFVLNKAE